MFIAGSPIRWPNSWKDPAFVGLLKGTAINCLLVERSADLGLVVAQAQRDGLQIADAASPPAGVVVIEGEWPGVKMSPSGALDQVSAGPTGNPWVDSNGWKIRLAAELNPEAVVWIDAAPKEPRLFTESYLVGIADSAAYGGRWIVSLDTQLAAGIAGQERKALETWKKLTGAASFFADRKAWSDFRPEAVVGVVSDFSGPNEFLSHELLNLVARTNQQYRIILKNKAASLSGLRAILYVDAQPPAPDLRRQILAFVQAGGMLIAGPKWGQLPGAAAQDDAHPRYALGVLGKGRVAVAKRDIDDPYLLANDSVVLISHRYELLRFWNGGAIGSYFTMAPDSRRAVVHMLFYAGARGGDPTVRVARRYRTARLWTLDQPVPRGLEMEIQKDAVEVHLPPVSVYAAVELEA